MYGGRGRGGGYGGHGGHEKRKIPTFLVLCPGRHAGGFIGKEGRSIENLRAQTGANVKIAHFESGVNNNTRNRDRLIRISGSPADIFDCVRLIATRFQEIAMDTGGRFPRDGGMNRGNDRRMQTYQVSVLVPVEAMGKVCGQQQKHLRDLSGHYGAEVMPGRNQFDLDPAYQKITIRCDMLDNLAEATMKLFESIISSTQRNDYNPAENHSGPYPPKVTSNGYVTTTIGNPGETQPPQRRNNYGGANGQNQPPPPPPNAPPPNYYPSGDPYNGGMPMGGNPYAQPPPPGVADGGFGGPPGFRPPPSGAPTELAMSGVPPEQGGPPPGFQGGPPPMGAMPPGYGYGPPGHGYGMMGPPGYGKQFAPY